MPTTPATPAIPGTPANPGTPAIPGVLAVPATAHTPATPRTHGTSAIYPTPDIPGAPAIRWKPLKSATNEVKDIWSVVNEQSDTELPEYHVIHFACHGVSDPKTPSNSHLLVHEDNPSVLGKLTVEAISLINIKHAQVAYLSACSIAENPRLADESIHIASGFQLAGFSHLPATMWESDDEACWEVAVEFYRSLFNGQPDGGHRVVSIAFHFAVKRLGQRMLRQPIKIPLLKSSNSPTQVLDLRPLRILFGSCILTLL
ncbi:hypothetical protein Q9L58_010380 [Maublancomyces gigas]|uniref:CHAT domain-containing protein n=1 Tax=Discina gigas TaxID=1032678 RepID=A0ABR3G4A6_9PEZI